MGKTRRYRKVSMSNMLPYYHPNNIVMKHVILHDLRNDFNFSYRATVIYIHKISGKEIPNDIIHKIQIKLDREAFEMFKNMLPKGY